MIFTHLIKDDKFLKMAYRSFNSFTSIENKFIIFSTTKDVKCIDFPVTIIHPDKALIEGLSIINSSDLLVIHFLDRAYFDLIDSDKILPKILWIGWGADYYWLIETLADFNMYKPITNEYVFFSSNYKIINLILKLVKKYRRKRFIKVINKITFFAPVLCCEFDLIKSNYPNVNFQCLDWNYGTLEEDYVKGLKEFSIAGDDIFVGNSATMTSNHIDVFEVLSGKIGIGCKIIVPLSYGDTNYAKRVRTKGREMFGDNFISLDYFMEYDEYLKVLDRCRNVFMGHIRQQALGNIVAFLYFGANLFLYQDSVLYNFLKEKGLIFFSIEEFIVDPNLINTKLSKEDIEHNQTILISMIGKNVSRKKTKEIIQLVEASAINK